MWKRQTKSKKYEQAQTSNKLKSFRVGSAHFARSAKTTNQIKKIQTNLNFEFQWSRNKGLCYIWMCYYVIIFFFCYFLQCYFPVCYLDVIHSIYLIKDLYHVQSQQKFNSIRISVGEGTLLWALSFFFFF